MIDSKIRDDFIGLDKKVFFNNAAYAPMLRCVRSAIDNYLAEVDNLRAADFESIAKLEQLRANCARLICARKEEVGFAYNTSLGLNLAAAGIDYQPGDEIIIADNEFPAVFYPFKELEQRGVRIRLAPTDADNFSLEEVDRLATGKTRVLAVSFVQYFNGYRNDLEAIGEYCRDREILFVVDGIQGIGCCPIDVHECHIDILACGAQKWLLALPGCGFFFVSDKAKGKIRSPQTSWFGIDWEMNFTDLRHFDRPPFPDARRFTSGSYPFLHLWVLEASSGYLLKLGIDRIYQHNLQLLDQLIAYTEASDYYQLRSSVEPVHRSSIISIGSPAGADLAKYLVSEGIYLVYREGGVRVSMNFYNTPKEVELLIEKLDHFRQQR